MGQAVTIFPELSTTDIARETNKLTDITDEERRMINASINKVAKEWRVFLKDAACVIHFPPPRPMLKIGETDSAKRLLAVYQDENNVIQCTWEREPVEQVIAKDVQDAYELIQGTIKSLLEGLLKVAVKAMEMKAIDMVTEKAIGK